MKRLLFVVAVAAVVVPVFPAGAGVSVSVGEPGFYGRIDIGNAPPPPLIRQEPIVVERAPEGVVREPIYVRVPPGHRKHWRKHCHEYNACGQPVYFVRDDWYTNEYAPRFRNHGHDQGEVHGKGHGRGHGDESEKY